MKRKPMFSWELVLGAVVGLGVLAALGFLFSRASALTQGKINIGIYNPIGSDFQAAKDAGCTMFRSGLSPVSGDAMYNLGVQYGLDQLVLVDNYALPTNWDLPAFDSMLTQEVQRHTATKYYSVFAEADYRVPGVNDPTTGYLNVPDLSDLKFSRYMEVLRHASQILHSAGRFLVAPGFTYLGTQAGWYKRFFDAGGDNLVDFVDWHPYNVAESMDWWIPYLTAERARFTKPFLNTEYAVPDNGTWDQSTYIVEEFEHLGLFFQNQFWWVIRDSSAGIAGHSGVLKLDMSKKPSFNTVQQINFAP